MMVIRTTCILLQRLSLQNRKGLVIPWDHFYMLSHQKCGHFWDKMGHMKWWDMGETFYRSWEMQSLRGEVQSQMNRLGREGETTMIHLGARHDIIKEMISKPETWHDIINKAWYHEKMISKQDFRHDIISQNIIYHNTDMTSLVHWSCPLALLLVFIGVVLWHCCWCWAHWSCPWAIIYCWSPLKLSFVIVVELIKGVVLEQLYIVESPLELSFGIVIVVELIGVVLEQLNIVKVQSCLWQNWTLLSSLKELSLSNCILLKSKELSLAKLNIVELIKGVVLEQLYTVKSPLELFLGIVVQSPEITFGKTEWLYFQGSPYS